MRQKCFVVFNHRRSEREARRKKPAIDTVVNHPIRFFSRYRIGFFGEFVAMRISLRALLCVLQKDDRRFLSTHTITTTYTYQFWTLLFGVRKQCEVFRGKML